ncbi:hypothetical protein [Halopenitus malekzadehii]|uniref:hypothetical protein n=1 Tax=Halopenitus malekzadehii TaxID=1267564 RepID=UPI0015A6B5CE|nr:hypothetical protein [Halopenitus malekzadehii]
MDQRHELRFEQLDEQEYDVHAGTNHDRLDLPVEQPADHAAPLYRFFFFESWC